MALPLILAACSPMVVGDGPSARNELLAKPTIISLNPCTDAILAEVADPAQLLAISAYSHDPASSSMDPALAARFHSTSGSVEEILALKPDLVVSGTFTPPATAAALARLGFKLHQLPIAPTVADSKTQVMQLAVLAGHPERGAALVARIDAALAAARTTKPPVSAVIWQSGGLVAGDGTLIADLLTHTGFTNHAAARGLGQAQHLPLEAMLADPPGVILASGDPRANQDRLLNHPALAALTGTRRARLDSALLWCGGPTIPKAAARLAQVRRSLGEPIQKPLPGGEGLGWGLDASVDARHSPRSPTPVPSPRGRGE